MSRLADRAFGEEGLRRAWLDVLANDLADGELGAAVARFQADADVELPRLVAALACGGYDPHDLVEVVVADSDKQRVLDIPAVRDRIVERSILREITPLVDPALGPASYAYRPGLGVVDAVQAVVTLREEGMGWVLRTDVDECFPTIPVGLARRMLGSLVEDAEVLRVIDMLLARCRIVPGRGRLSMRGLAQGCALSPLMANLVLARVDAHLMAAGFSVVRYSDDLVIAAESKDEAWEAARTLTAALDGLGMRMGEDKTDVMSFEEGFCFLGEDFGPRYPPALTDAKIEEPEQKSLYVALQGSRVRTAEGRLIVETADEERVLDVATGHIKRLVCFGSVGVSAGVRSWAMSTNVDVVFASRRGSYLGSLVAGASSARAGRVRAQVAIQGTTEALAVARAIVEAKVRKQIVVLQRFGRRGCIEEIRGAISSMENALRLLPDATSTDEAMGLEGAAAAAYFPALGSLMPDDLSFDHRTRRPPLDITNAALSLGYTILLGECVTALYAAGLDPAFGVLHSDHEDRPSLALDLLEELRPMVVDQVVLTAARTHQLTAAHARTEDGRAGVLLTGAGREALLNGYERRMLTRTKGALPDFSGTLRRHLYRQAQRLAASILEPGHPWTGLSWR